MPTINPTTLRTQTQRAIPYLSIFQPVTLLTALVNNAAIARGARSIVYDTGSGSGFATIAAGQTLEVDTADGTKRIRVKSITGNQTSGTITIDENGIVFADNQVIRIKHFYEVHPVPPRISGGVFYKFFDTAYSNQNSLVNPIAIAGSHRAGFLSAGSITFNITAADSYAMAQGATISTYAWTCVHNGGGTTGITIANAAIATTTITFTLADQYWLKLVVTDSNGKQTETYRAIFVYERGVTDPYTDFTIQSLSGDWNSGGWKLSISAVGDVDLAEFPDRSLAVLWYENYFNSTLSYINLWGVSDEILTCGYLRQDTDNDDFSDGTGNITFNITTIDDLLNNVTQLGSISLNATSAPSTWYQYSSWMTAGRSVHHLLFWHAWGVFQAVDVYGLTDNASGVLNTDYTESSLLQQANSFAFNRGIFAKLISDRLGRLHFVQDSQMLNDAGRAALDTVFTITEADISGVVDVIRQPEEAVTFTELDGFSFNGSVSTPFLAIIPGYVETISNIIPEERGGGTAAVSNQILDDQTDANERIGRFHAQQNNNPREIRFDSPANYIGAYDIIPSIGWYEWGIADNDLKRDTPLFERLLICRNVSCSFDYGQGSFTGVIQTSVAFEPEAIGPDGIPGNYPTSYPDASDNNPDPDWDEPLSNVILTFRDDSDSAGKAVIAVAGSLSFGTIATFEAGATSYTSVCALSATKAVVCFRDEGDSNQGKACVLDISGTTITPGTAAIFETGNTTEIDVCALSATQALVCYRDGGNSNVGTACILDISGSTVTPATPAVFEPSSTFYCSVAPLTATKAIVCYQDAGNTFHGTACVLDVSGSTITPATPAEFWNQSMELPNCVPISSTSVLVSFIQNTSPLAVSALVIDDITTTFTANAGYLLDNANGGYDSTEPGNHRLRMSSTTQAILLYQSNAASSNPFTIFGQAFTIDSDGTTIIPGTPVQISSDQGGYDEDATISLVSTTKAVVFYTDQIGADGYAFTLDFVGGTITENEDEALVSAVYSRYTSSATLEAP